MKEKISIEDIAVFCKKKGFVFPNSEIYGGMTGFFDYGPLGVELKENIKKEFWKRFVQQREDITGIDGAIITHPKVWEASGHVDSFTDYIYDCDKCKIMFKGEDNKGIGCPKCKTQLKNPKKFNLMFKTNIGPVESKENISYLRPETAQLIFTNYKLVQETARKKLPFGIAQIGKAFRNEISPRDFLFRSREFEQFEIEFFVHPDKINNCQIINEVSDLKINLLTADMQKKNLQHKKSTIKELINNKLVTEWHAYWLGHFYKWFLDFGLKKENLRLREHLKDELAHYASGCFDLEYNFPFGWKEIHGNANRQQFDLKQHMLFSKTNLEYYDEEKKEKVIPYVASEPSQGIDRAFLAFMFDAYNFDKKRGNIILKLHPKLAPIKIGVFPLVSNKAKLVKKAREVYGILNDYFNCRYDISGSIGRRYARADEIGIYTAVTVDFDSLKDNCVTLRSRDTTKQIRLKISELKDIIQKLIEGEKFENCGKIIK